MNIEQIKQWLSTPEMQEKLRYGGYGALAGAGLGGINHLMTNEDEEGSGGRLMKNLALGGAMGGVAGLGAHSAKDLMKPVKEKSELEAFLDKRPHPFSTFGNIAKPVTDAARNPWAMGVAGAGASMAKDWKYINGKDSPLKDATKLISGKDGAVINEQWGGKHLGTEHSKAREALTGVFAADRVSPQTLDAIRKRIGSTTHMPVGHQNDLHAALGDQANRYVSPLGGALDKTLGGVANTGIGLWNKFNQFLGKPAPATYSPSSVMAGANTGLKPAGFEWLNKLTGLQTAGGDYARNAVLPGAISPTVAQSLIKGTTPLSNAGRMAGNAGKWGVAAGLGGKFVVDPLMNMAGDKWLQTDAYKKHMQQAYEMAQQATKQQAQQVR
ncbi:MAG: hypothetical protein EBU46_00935 [Nitrosomonadaceae bacterium]|nr:hypothetical protein [Nitrosomonadaceae bacterium]